MKMNYKVASLALVGAILAQTFVPMSALAEEEIGEVQVENEAVAEAEPAGQVVTIAGEQVTETVSTDSTNEAANIDSASTVEATSTTDVALAADATPATDSTDAVTEESNEVEELEEGLIDELEKDEMLELVEADEKADFNNDGINDLYTKMLCDGEILTEAGDKVFGDKSYATVQSTNDLDGDGVLNGEEVEIRDNGDGTYTAVLKSNPCLADSDEDGIDDLNDTARMEYGLAGGVLGSVRLIAHHDDNENFIDGHVYIVYTSYVNNLEINIDNLYGYYLANPEKKALLDSVCDGGEDAKVVSWRSTVDEINAANEEQRRAAADELYIPQNHEIYATGTVRLNRGDYVSIGNYTMLSQQEIIETDYLPFIKNDLQHLTEAEKLLIIDFAGKILNQTLDEDYFKDHIPELLPIIAQRAETFMDHALFDKTTGGVWVNRELNHQKLGYDQGPNECVELDATREQLNVMLDHFASNSYYNIFTHNCVTAGADAWNAVYGVKQDENGNTVKTGYYVNHGTEIPFITDRNTKEAMVISHPGAVKESVKSMKDLPGYIGNITYVTGKKLVDKVAAAVKKFDITKLFRKKAATKTENKPSHTVVTEDSSSSDEVRTSFISSVVNVFTGSDEEVIAANDELDTVEAETEQTENLEKKEAFKKAYGKTETSSKAESSSKTETSVSRDDVKLTASNVQSKTIASEDVPLSVVSEHDPLLWAWFVIVLLVVSAGVATVVAVAKRKNN